MKNFSSFNEDETIRYSRHFSLNEIGTEGQQKLKSAKVLCVGAGGLGSPLLLYLAAAGIGTIGIIDDDKVSLDNLQRQILYDDQTVNMLKTDAAKLQLHKLNPNINIVCFPERLCAKNALDIIKNYDIVADCTDNFASHYLINDACFHLGKPDVFASISKFIGQCSLFNSRKGPCYRCLFPEPPAAHQIPDCNTAGVLGVLPGLLGTIQATEICKWLLQIGTSLVGRVMIVNALPMKFSEIALLRDPDCRLCYHNEKFNDLTQTFREDTMQTNTATEITTQQLIEMIQQKKDIFILDVRTSEEYARGHIENSYLIPLNELPARLHELDKNHNIVVYCQAGYRSFAAMDLLQTNGFNSVVHLKTGFAAWPSKNVA